MVMEEGGVFGPGVEAWRRGLGQVRDVVRQELVLGQVLAQLEARFDGGGPPGARAETLEILDVGCGQGTVAVGLARAGYRVVGVDTSVELLALGIEARDREPVEVAGRLTFAPGDLRELDASYLGRFALVCCHGVLMYLPSLVDGIAELVRAVRPGGLLSVLTRNQPSLAMRAGMQGDWVGARASFDARYYRNRVGLADVRADQPAEVAAVLARAGAPVVAAYGVRLFTDHWANVDPPPDIDVLLAVEAEAAGRDPYRQLASLTHTVGRRRRAPGPSLGGDRSGRPLAVLDDPAVSASDPGELLIGYLDWYRRALERKLDGLSEAQLHAVVEPLRWAPLGLIQHLGWVERRWMRWGFAAEDVTAWHPDGDDAEWVVAADVVRAAFDDEVARSTAMIAGTGLDERAALGGRFETVEEAPTLGRILFHLLQEYARHAGQLDVARELIDRVTGE